MALEVFDQTHSEPTDASWEEAIACATEGDYDGFVGLGGGSCLDTAKAVNIQVFAEGKLVECFINDQFAQAYTLDGLPEWPYEASQQVPLKEKLLKISAERGGVEILKLLVKTHE